MVGGGIEEWGGSEVTISRGRGNSRGSDGWGWGGGTESVRFDERWVRQETWFGRRVVGYGSGWEGYRFRKNSNVQGGVSTEGSGGLRSSLGQ